MPQVFVPFTSLATNSRFTGSPIVPQYMKSYLPDSAQDYPWTNAMLLTAFKKNPEWGGWQGLSPIAIEHIIKSYTGTIGSYIMDFIVDPAFREEGVDLSGGLIPAKPDVTGLGFGTWDNAPLIKRLFVGETPRHTKNIIDSYKLKNEVTKRVNELKKLKDEGFIEQAIQLAQSPGMQDILALDKGLQGQFEKLQEISKAEKLVFSKTFEGSAKFRGEQLEEIRKQKIKLTDELIGMLEGYNLDYIIPRTVTLPFSGSQIQLPKKARGQSINIGSANITNSSKAFGNSITEMLHGN